MSHLFTRTGLVTGALGFDPASREGSNPTAPTPKSRHNFNVWGLRTSCLFSNGIHLRHFDRLPGLAYAANQDISCLF